MKRLNDEEMTEYIETATEDPYNKQSITLSNLVIVELLNRLLEKPCTPK